jgi:uncharacterized membrane-anchored protein YitT (DUF2179 family)
MWQFLLAYILSLTVVVYYDITSAKQTWKVYVPNIIVCLALGFGIGWVLGKIQINGWILGGLGIVAGLVSYKIFLPLFKKWFT